jgi:protein-L-isoaspartate O-methyltransferase
MTACLAQLAGPTGHVLALEKQPKLVQRSQASIKASLPDVCAAVDVRVCNVMAGACSCRHDNPA